MTIVPSMGDLQTAARTIFGEARGESDEGQRWVAATIITRAQRGGWWGSTLGTVCKKPWQYSCWNARDPNRRVVESLQPDEPEFLRALENLTQALRHGVGETPTHYHTTSIRPAWSDAESMRSITTIGRHRFYEEI